MAEYNYRHKAACEPLNRRSCARGGHTAWNYLRGNHFFFPFFLRGHACKKWQASDLMLFPFIIPAPQWQHRLRESRGGALPLPRSGIGPHEWVTSVLLCQVHRGGKKNTKRWWHSHLIKCLQFFIFYNTDFSLNSICLYSIADILLWYWSFFVWHLYLSAFMEIESGFVKVKQRLNR